VLRSVISDILMLASFLCHFRLALIVHLWHTYCRLSAFRQWSFSGSSWPIMGVTFQKNTSFDKTVASEAKPFRKL